MIELLRVDLNRMKKNKFFRVATVLMLLMGIYLPIVHYFDAKGAGFELPLESGFFTYSTMIIIIMSVFCGLFIGTDYSDGTIRNKLIAGHTRASVYMSNFIVSTIASIIICAVHMAAYLCVGIPLLGFFGLKITQVLYMVGAIFMMSLAFTSIYVLIAMLCHSKAASSVVCVLSVFTLLFVGIFITSSLNEPEMYSSYTYTDDSGVTLHEDASPNPNYLRGTKRQVYEFLLDFTPGGQALQLSSGTPEHHARLPAYSAALIFLTTAFGLGFFRKKDLK